MNVVLKTAYNIDKWIRPYAYIHEGKTEKTTVKSKPKKVYTKGKKKTVYIELPSENIDDEINKIMAGTETEIDHWLSGKETSLVNDELIIYIKEVF